MAETIASLQAVIGADISGLQRGLQAAQGMLNSTANTMKSIGAGLTAGLTLPIVGLGIASAKSAITFDKSMRNIQATAGLSQKEIAAMSTNILDMSKNSVYGANQIADAMYDIVGGVSDASKWNAILAQSLKTAEAGQANLKATTSGLIFIMNAYNLSAKDASMVSDVLTRTVGVGVGTMDEFVGAMSPIAITAKTLKVDFKDLGAMTAFLTTKGNSASESATQLQAIMQALLKPTKQMKDAMKALGYENGSAMLKALGFTGTLNALKKQTNGNTDALAKMFGRVEAFKGVLALTNGDFAAFNKNFQSGVAGATASAQAIQAQSFDSQIKKLQSSMEALGIQIGTVLLPPIMKFVEVLSQVVGEINKLSPSIVPVIVGVAAFAAALGPVIGIIGTIISVINPVTLAIAALAAAFATNFLGIRDAVMNVVNTIRPVIEDIVKRFQTFIAILTQPGGTDFFDRLKTAVTTAFPEIAQTLKDFNTNVIQPTISVLKDLWTLVEPYLTQLKDWFIADALPKISLALAMFNAMVIQPTIAALKNIWNQAGPTLRLFAAWFHESLPAIKLTVDVVINAIMNKIRELMALIQAGLGKIDQLKTQAAAAAGALGLGGPAPTVNGTTVGKAPAAQPEGGGNILSNLLKGLLGRDSGGMGVAGKPVMIGSGAQPELFVPSTAGNFFPAGAMAGAGGGPIVIQNTLTLEAEGFRQVILKDVATGIRAARR